MCAWLYTRVSLLGRAGSTKYEERGRKAGSVIHNLCYRFMGP